MGTTTVATSAALRCGTSKPIRAISGGLLGPDNRMPRLGFAELRPIGAPCRKGRRDSRYLPRLGNDDDCSGALRPDAASKPLRRPAFGAFGQWVGPCART